MASARRARRWSTIVIALSLLLTASPWAPDGAEAAPTPCAAPSQGAPMFVTEDCVDPRFNDAYLFVDLDVVRDLPIPHRVVLGGFRGTGARFAFYFPLDSQYQGRFIQGPVHQLRLTGEVATPDELQYAFGSGAYLVETNNGGHESCLTARDCIDGDYDGAIRGYRVAAAAAKYSREVAQRVYGYAHRPYGYLYGGSGGAYMTISSAEHTSGVWDGFLPFVFGHPLAIPNHYSVRINALRVLRQRNKLPCIVDAVEAGGSGDPFTSCRLNEVESAALREATRMGYPPRGWFDHATMTGGALLLVADYVPLLDPSYDDDFWTQPGYLGTEPSAVGDSVRAARVQHPATVLAALPDLPPPLEGVPTPPYELLGPAYSYYMVAQYAVGLPPNAFVLDSLPVGRDLEGADIVATSGPATGQSCPLMVHDAALRLVGCGPNSDPDVVNAIGQGDTVRIDNSRYLALQTHHRHQVPADRDLYGWDQFRTDPDGSPNPPQRDLIVGPIDAFNASGSVSTGRFHGKMIMVENLLDQDAFAWSADWYRRQVVKARGADAIDEDFRLYLNDNAIHAGSPDPNYTVDYDGILQQGLRDLFAWVEADIAPPASTSYTVGGRWDPDEAQLQLPASAAERRGIQPVVDLRVVGGPRLDRAEIRAGETVTFKATIEVPPGAGQVTCATWAFEAPLASVPSPTAAIPVAGLVDPGGNLLKVPGLEEDGCGLSGRRVTLETSHTYATPGTYFVVLRATSQRQGITDVPYTLVKNLDRVRVVVR